MPEPPSPSTPHVAGSAFPAPAGQPHVNAGQEHNGRNETRLERCDRNLVELLQEVRVAQTGERSIWWSWLTAS